MPPQNTSETIPPPEKIENGNSNETNGTTEKMELEAPEYLRKLKEIEQFEREDLQETAAVVVPPDGGWGWVVMVASFLCCTVVDGIVFNAGKFQDPIRLEYNVSKGYIALVSSLLSGFYLIAGPFASAFANRWGFRIPTIIGAIIASIAFAVSYFATSVEFLFIVYGVIGGIGFSLIYIPSVITIGYYFEKWRALATGIALCGSGVGTFVFTPVNEVLLKTFGWRYSLLIQAVIILSCILFAIVYRPITPIQVPIEKNMEELKPLNGHHKLPMSKDRKPLPEGRYAYSVPNSIHNTYTGQPAHTHYPTAAEVFQGSTADLERKLSGAGLPRKSLPTTPNGETAQQFNFNVHQELTPVGENEEVPESHKLLESGVKPIIVQARRNTVTERRESRSNRNSRHDPIAESRPLYRDDIFFTGSLVRIPQYQSQSSLAYHMSVTRLPTKQDIIETRERKCTLCPEAVRRTLSTMLDMTLLKSPSFMLLSVSGFLTMMGFFIPFIYIERRAVEAGMSDKMALFIVPAIGITNTIARIVCGLASSLNINALYLNNIAITAGGIATCVSGYLITEATQFAYAVVFGICIACFSALRSIIAVELMGLEKLTNAFGFLMLFQGVAAAIGAPIAGVFYDVTGSYDASFWLAGVLITISAFLCYPLNMVAQWEKKRALEKSNALA